MKGSWGAALAKVGGEGFLRFHDEKGQPCKDLGKELSKQKEQESKDGDSGECVMTWRWEGYQDG